MAAIDFPNSPATNDIHSVAGKSWLYDGTSWTLIGVSTSVSLNSFNLDGGMANTVYGGVSTLSGGGATG